MKLTILGTVTRQNIHQKLQSPTHMFLLLFFLLFGHLEGFIMWMFMVDNNFSHTEEFKNTMLATKTGSFVSVFSLFSCDFLHYI